MPLGDLPPKLQLPPAITPTELFWSGDGQPWAHPCTLQGHLLPVHQGRCSHTAFAHHHVHEESCATCSPTVLRDPEGCPSTPHISHTPESQG